MDRSRSAPDIRLFLLPLAVGALLRLFGLTRQSLWVDEFLTIWGASLGDPFSWHDVLVNPQGPLPQVLLRLWTVVGGDGDLSLRLWAAAAGVAGLLVATAAFRRVRPRAALLGVWLLALSPFHIWYSQEVRNYVFLLGAALLVLWTLIRALERPSASAWTFHGAALAVMLLCNLSGGLLLPALALFLIIDHPRRFLPWVTAAAVAVAIASPWIWVELNGHVEWSGISETTGTGPVRGSLTFHPLAVPFALASFLGGFGLGPPLRALHESQATALFRPHLPWLLAAGLGAGAALLAAALRIREARVRLLFLWTLIPIGLAVVVALFGFKAFNARYVAVAQPVFLLLLAEGVVALRRRVSVLGIVVLAMLVIPMLFGWARQTFDPEYGREDYRGAARFIAGAARPGDVILEQGVHGPLERYYQGEIPVYRVFESYLRGAGGGVAKLEEFLDGRESVWWVGSRLWWEDPEGRVRQWLGSRGAPIAEWERGGVQVVGFRLDGPSR